MPLNYEVPVDRVTTFDPEGHRVGVFPARVRGWFRPRRTLFEGALLALFLALPCVPVGGQPAVFLNVAAREFHVFGWSFWATDAPLVFLLLAAFFASLMAVTALWGRVWCGWACPQTVMVDLVYRRLEEWIEGDSPARRRLQAAPWGPEKILRKTLKWLAYALISAFFAHAFLAYFVSWRGWAEIYSQGFRGSAGAGVMLILSSIVFLLDFGWFREQFCVIACPYGRWQSVWLDRDSMVVGYDRQRGEPRRGLSAPGAPVGDCANCFRCVQVCPTGIDIRRGVQMECVACTACIDACDEVMAVLGRAPGLVRYTSQNQDQSADSHARPFRIRWRVRPLAYFAVATLLLGTFGTLVNTRPGLQMEVLRMKGPPYLSKAADGGATEVVNLFQISVRNRTGSPISVSVEAAGIEGLRLTGQTRAVELGSGEQRRLAIVATALFPAGTLGPSRPIRIEVRGTGPGNQETRVSQSVPMITPLR